MTTDFEKKGNTKQNPSPKHPAPQDRRPETSVTPKQKPR